MGFLLHRITHNVDAGDGVDKSDVYEVGEIADDAGAFRPMPAWFE
jgi:hypothetical protein